MRKAPFKKFLSATKAALLCCFSLAAFHSQAEDSETLTIYTEEFPPYNYQKNGQIRGINTRLTESICQQAGIKCEFILYHWNRAFANTLNNPKSGLISTSRHPERESQFKWVGPLESGNDRTCFYKLSKRIDIPMLLNRETLKQYSFPVVRNDIYDQIFTAWGLNDKEHFVTYSNKHEGIKQFAAGRIDLMIASPFTLLTLLSESGLTIDNVYPVMNVADDDFGGNFLALNPAVPDSLVTKLQNALNNIPQGKRDKLALTYMNLPERASKVDFKTEKCL